MDFQTKNMFTIITVNCNEPQCLYFLMILHVLISSACTVVCDAVHAACEHCHSFVIGKIQHSLGTGCGNKSEIKILEIISDYR